VQPIVPPVYRTGNPDLDRNFDAIAAAFRRLNLGSGDHLVIVDKSDTPDTVENKVVQGTGVTIEKTGKAGDRQLTVSADAGGIVNEITNNETLVTNISNSLTTNETFVTNVTNITEVNSTTPTAVATTLFPALKPDPLNDGFFACVFKGGHNKGGNDPMLFGWVEISPGVIEYQTLGLLDSAWLDGVDPTPAYGKASSLIGKAVLAYYQGDTSILGDEEKLQGKWIFDSVGFEWQPTSGHPGTYSGVTTYPRMHRAPGFTPGTSLPAGATLQAQTGNSWGTKFFTLNTTAVIGTDPLSFTVTDSKTWTDRHLLCTSPELTTENVSLAAQTVEGTIGGSASSDTTNPIANSFVAASALGITSIPAEPFEIDIASVYVAGLNYDSVLTVGAQLWEVTPDGVSEVGAMIAAGECTPLSNGTTSSIVFHATPSAVRSVSPTNKLMMLWTLHLEATSAQATITVRISYGAPWGTKITVPWQMSVTGVATGAHDQLDHRNFKNQHPNCSVHPVLSTSASVGWIWLGNGPANDRGVSDRSDYVKVTLQGDTYGDGVYGIKPTWQDGTEIPDGFLVGVYIANATPSTQKKAVSGATPPTGSGFLPLANDALPNGAGKQHTFNGPTELVYRLDLTEQRWRLVSFQTYAVVTS
jgi:hypothetical protein